MISDEKLLLILKSSILEQCLKHRVDEIVFQFSIKSSEKFSSFPIPPMRFANYQIYLWIKDKTYEKFGAAIEFLEKFNSDFPDVIDKKLFQRVIVSFKSLFLYDCIKQNRPNFAAILNSYFPNAPLSECSNDNFNLSEDKLLAMRLHFEELKLSKPKRQNVYFESNYKKIFSETYLKFLLKKTCNIVDCISFNMLPTKIDELIEKNLQNPCRILLNSDDELSEEGEIWMNLFLDVIKKELNNENELVTNLNRLIVQLSSQDSNRTNIKIPSQTSMVHGLLYMDSQITETTKLDDNQSEKSTQQTQTLSTQSSSDKIPADLITDDEQNVTSP